VTGSNGGVTVALDIETVGDWPADYAIAIGEMAAKVNLDPESFAALSPPLARVVCVGMRQVETGREQCFYDADLVKGEIVPVGSPPPVTGKTGERELLEAVNTCLAKTRTLVTFNGRGFDVPVLVHRMVAHELMPCDFLIRAARESRYPNWKGTPRLHVDLREQMTFYGASNGAGTSLRAFAIGYGLPDPKSSGDGASVSTLVERGDAAGLCSYCMSDVRTATELYRRWLECCGVA
jgi:hypothetical protein